MKKTLHKILLLLLITFLSSKTFAQNESKKSQLFLVHEDKVLPHMAEKYEAAMKNLKGLFKSNNIETNYHIAQIEYFTYSAIMPIEDYNGISSFSAMFRDLSNKIGKEKLNAAMNRFDGCYDTHKTFLVKLRNDLSYNNKYGLDLKEELNFRHFDYFYVIPGKEGEMNKLLKELKELHEEKNINQGYRIYQGDLGTDSPMVLMVKSFKDRIAWATESVEISKKLGKRLNELRQQMIAIMQKFEHENGTIRTDLSNAKNN